MLYIMAVSITALIIHFDSSQEVSIKGVDADEDYVKYLNNKMIESSEFFVFSENERQVKELLS